MAERRERRPDDHADVISGRRHRDGPRVDRPRAAEQWRRRSHDRLDPRPSRSRRSWPNGGVYSVSVETQPNIGPLQVCTVTNGDGNVAGASVTNIAVNCVTKFSKFLYVTNPTANNVSGYTINASTGALTAVAGSPFATEPSSALRDGGADRQVRLRDDAGHRPRMRRRSPGSRSTERAVCCPSSRTRRILSALPTPRRRARSR